MAYEPHASGSPGSLDEALRAARTTGRTRLYGPPKLRAIDKSNEAFDLTYFDPPAGLERHVLALFEMQYREGPVEDRHVGALGQFFLVVRGRATGHFDSRTDIVETSPILLNAFDIATPYHADGPFWCVGASLSPFGWAALTKASVYEYRNRYIPAGELLGNDVDRLQDKIRHGRRSSEMTSEEACFELSQWIADRLSPIPEAHEALIEKTLAWLGSSLNPPVEELFEGSSYSRRQIERLVQQYFGFAPRGLARKFRAIRAANLLAQPDLTDEGEAEIACAFVDQPHMIREIRRFCGYTPSRLGGCDDAMFLRLTNMQNLDRFRPYRAVGSGTEADGPPL